MPVKAKFKPGDNPNKLNRKSRIGPRPRTQNSPSPPKPRLAHSWVDPLPDVPPIDALDMEEVVDTIPAATVELEPKLPQTIAASHCNFVITAAQNTHLTASQAQRVSDKLDALVHYKSARQLYSAMQDPDKSLCQPLKCVYYDTAEIPKHLSAAISIIGNFDSRIGRVEVAHAPTLFRRWISRGLTVDPDADYSDDDPLSAVWRDRDGKRLVDELAEERINELATVDFVRNGVHSSLAPITRAPNPGEYFTWIPDDHPHSEVIKDLTSLIELGDVGWMSGAPLPHGRNSSTAVGHLGLHINGVTDSILRDRFTSAMHDYIAGSLVHMRTLFTLGPAPQGSRGFAAQLVSSSENRASYQLPLSDADRAIGFLYSPCAKFKMNPSFIAYSRTRKSDSVADFAARDGTRFTSG
jgi:hypothetical protein